MASCGRYAISQCNDICFLDSLISKHTDFRTEKTQLRRSRRLVIGTFTTVANYDYGINWILYQDGTIEVCLQSERFENN